MSKRFEFKPIPNLLMADLNAAYLAESKWLSDAECAAEYWRAESELTNAVLYNGRVQIVDGNMPAMADTGACGWRAMIWHRFATHPHAHEGP